jgi:hypothetical protein
VRIVVGVPQGPLQLGRPSNDILGEFPALPEQPLLLLMGVLQRLMDLLVLNPKPVKRGVGAQVG